ncbi:MAG: hypothetical protein ACLFPD_06400 [Desulfosudaceae bacterium]
MRQVKGTLFINIAKNIKADKTGVFDKFLTDEDRQILSKLILQSAWYPYETYRNCLTAIAAVLAKNDPDILKDWGREQGQATMETIYKLALKKDDAQEAMNSYDRVVKAQFNFGSITGTMVGDQEMHITMEGFDKDFEAWYHIASGWMEKYLELVLKKPVKSRIIKKSWEGAPATVFQLTW